MRLAEAASMRTCGAVAIDDRRGGGGGDPERELGEGEGEWKDGEGVHAQAYEHICS